MLSFVVRLGKCRNNISLILFFVLCSATVQCLETPDAIASDLLYTGIIPTINVNLTHQCDFGLLKILLRFHSMRRSKKANESIDRMHSNDA